MVQCSGCGSHHHPLLCLVHTSGEYRSDERKLCPIAPHGGIKVEVPKTKVEAPKAEAEAPKAKPKKRKASESPKPAANVSSPRIYHIIVASVGTSQDAQNMALTLTNKGFKNAKAIIGEGKMRVCIDSYASEAEAYRALNRYRENETFKNAWVLKKK